MEVDLVLERLKGLPGLMDPQEVALLCRMARSAKTIVELGCYKGRSMAAMALANPGAAVYGVDSFGDMNHRGYKGGSEAEVRLNMDRVGVEPAGVYTGTTDQAAGEWPEDIEIDLLHVDAGHSYDEVRRDIANWIPKVAPGGAVVFHDYGRARKEVLDRPEVKRAVDGWLRTKAGADWVEVERAGVSIAFRNMVSDQGALLIAYGDKAREGARKAIISLQKHAPSLPIVVITEPARPLGVDHHIPHPDFTPGARDIKTRIYSLSPWRKTLYLDADCVVRGLTGHTFALLDFFDVVLAIDPNKILSQVRWPALVPEEVEYTPGQIGTAEVQYYNSGVIAFGRSRNNRAMFQAWHEEWLKFQAQDQMALVRAIHREPVRIAPMREGWNTHIQARAEFVWHKHRTVARHGAPG